MYLPAEWWHATWNLDDSIALGWEGSHASKAWTEGMHAIADGDLSIWVYGIGCRTLSRTLIPNLGYEALLIGLKIQGPGLDFKSCRSSCRWLASVLRG